MTKFSRGTALAIFAGALAWTSPAPAAVSDAWITAKTKISLMTNEGLADASAINVDTNEGVVTLHGKVATADEKARAEEIARGIDGVKSVHDVLQVVPRGAEKAVKASDNEIKDRVQKALHDVPALRDSSISVASVNNGVVVLSGKASSVADHLQAVQVTNAVPGVRRVESEVQSPDRLADEDIRQEQSRQPTAGIKRGITDTARDMWITSDVKLRLAADEATPATDINVDTRNGIVTLFGVVPSQAAKSAADADARKVNGVARVVNELEIVPRSEQKTIEAHDDQLKDRIEHQLDARSDLKGTDIDVDVKNGIARLTGTVDSEQQRIQAALAARAVPGVRAVRDELRVKTARHG
jgi:hyperosmotically inducible protein